MYDIYYFSGTGNTKAVGELLKESLNCDMYCIEKDSYISNDMIVMFPIHGFGTPEIVLEWLNNLQPSTRKVAIITTAAASFMMNKSATSSAIKILESKGYKVCYDRIVVMPSNFVMSYPDEFVKQLYETAKVKVNHIVDELDNNIKRRYTNSYLELLTKPLYYGESIYATKAFGESLRVSRLCTKCGICVKLCPRDNIELIDDMIHFRSKCILCMRCVYRCPERAIESSWANTAIFSAGYNLAETLKRTIDSDYVTNKTKGFYKHFIQYIEDETI